MTGRSHLSVLLPSPVAHWRSTQWPGYPVTSLPIGRNCARSTIAGSGPTYLRLEETALVVGLRGRGNKKSRAHSQ